MERDEKRFAIILKADDSKWLFEAFPLDRDDTAWTGVSFGPVEIQVDLETGAFSDTIRTGRGAISVAGGRVYITAVPSGHLGNRITFEVGQGGPDSLEAAASFSGWRLIQRDHAGAPIVLFETA